MQSSVGGGPSTIALANAFSAAMRVPNVPMERRRDPSLICAVNVPLDLAMIVPVPAVRFLVPTGSPLR